MIVDDFKAGQATYPKPVRCDKYTKPGATNKYKNNNQQE